MPCRWQLDLAQCLVRMSQAMTDLGGSHAWAVLCIHVLHLLTARHAAILRSLSACCAGAAGRHGRGSGAQHVAGQRCQVWLQGRPIHRPLLQVPQECQGLVMSDCEAYAPVLWRAAFGSQAVAMGQPISQGLAAFRHFAISGLCLQSSLQVVHP